MYIYIYTLYKSPAAFYERLITVVIVLIRTTTAQKDFCITPWNVKKEN